MTSVVSMITVLAQGGGGRIVILIRKRGVHANLITGQLAIEEMSCFNGLFSDTDPEFIEFKAFVLSRITDAASGVKGVNRSAVDIIIDFISDYLDADISMMAVHSAKRLEWDTVFIPGVTRSDWSGVICSRCESAGMCSRSAQGFRIVYAKKKLDGFIEEMGLLYVGVTRACKAVNDSVSMQRSTNYGNYQVVHPSCLTSFPGIEPVGWTVMDGEG